MSRYLYVPKKFYCTEIRSLILQDFSPGSCNKYNCLRTGWLTMKWMGYCKSAPNKVFFRYDYERM